jgi:hypothetical protein
VTVARYVRNSGASQIGYVHNMRREQDQHGASLWTANLHAWLAPCVDLRWGSTCRDAWNASCLVAGSTLGPKHAPRHQHKLDPLDPTPIHLQTPCEVLGCTTTVAHCSRAHTANCLLLRACLPASRGHSLLPSTAAAPSWKTTTETVSSCPPRPLHSRLAITQWTAPARRPKPS